MNKKYRLAILLFAICALIFPSTLLAETANFDTLTEGEAGSELTDGDIRFTNPDNGNNFVDAVFVIEDADDANTDPNVPLPSLSVTGTSSPDDTPGEESNGFGYGVVKSMEMTTDNVANSASVDCSTIGTGLYGNTVKLEALASDGTTVVAEDEIAMSNVTDNRFTLEVTGADFESLRLSSSPYGQPLLIDNVTINSDAPDCACDIDSNGMCNLLDYNAFRQDWQRSDCRNGGQSCQCDIVGDNNGCNLLDYNAFRQAWQRDECRN